MTAFVTPPRRSRLPRRTALPTAAWTRLRRLSFLSGGTEKALRDRPRAVLLDLDGTLVRELPYNRDPEAVEPMPYAREALESLRSAGIRIGVVANQSGIGRGLLTEPEAGAVNEQVEKLLGPFDVWALCPHGPLDGCPCRKPRPGLVQEAARRLGLHPGACVVVGDVLGDVRAAREAGARPLLIAPRPPTTADLEPGHWAPDLAAAARLILGP
ncbi:MAG TPA: HAD-IIIA family hydrolase [Actinospica sp.]|jgi:HAD superfamily hydrolase (TIGR01662 family)|nr:HAD-IIIA family hydrolase [Actinospica sp.]